MSRPSAWRTSGALLAGLVMLAGPARSQAEAAAAPRLGNPERENAPASSDRGLTRNKSEAEAEPKKPGRSRCGCAASRLLKPRRGPAMLGAESSLAAWVDVGRTHIDTFSEAFFEGGTSSEGDAKVPVAEDLFAHAGEALAESRHRLIRLYPTAEHPVPFYVGLVRPKDKIPKNVAKAEVLSAADGPPPAGAAPVLEQLWLGPKESRTRGDCGEYETRRAMWRDAEGSPRLAGFLVRDADNRGEPVHLVDVRHVRMFGFGKVLPCDHGFPFETLSETSATTAIEVRPVSDDFGVGAPFVLELPEQGLPKVRSRPPMLGPSEENPFAQGLPGLEPSTLGHEEDKVALASILGVLGGAAAFAAGLWPVLRRRKKYLETVACSACGEELELDLADPKSDGMFCPACGGSSVFVSFEADGTPRAVVVAHTGASSERAAPAAAEDTSDAS